MGTNNQKNELTGKEVREYEIKRKKYHKREGEEGQSRISQLGSDCWVTKPNELEIVSIITKAAVENLNLKEGKEVYAIINAVDVILATDY